MTREGTQMIRWGIIGCGDVTEVKSGPALQKAERSALVHVMRRDGAKAADYAKRHDVPRWSDTAEAVLADEDVNAVYVATPPSSHAQYAIAALQAGKHVLLEKPIAMTAAESDAIEQAVAQTGGKLSVAYYRRALPRFEKLREIVQDSTIGAVSLIEVRQFKQAERQSAQSWKTDPAIGGGGSFVDMQSHTLDWLTAVFGRPVRVNGVTKNTRGLHDAEDFVSFELEFGGFAAVGLCHYAAPHEEESVTIYGERGTVEMGFFRPSEISLTVDGVQRSLALPDPAHVHQPFVERVVSYFLDDTPNPCGADAGRVSSDLIDQIYQRV